MLELPYKNDGKGELEKWALMELEGVIPHDVKRGKRREIIPESVLRTGL